MRFLQMRVHRKENDGEGAFISSIIRGWHGHGHIVLWLGWIGQLLVTRCSPSPAVVGSSLLGTSWGCLVIISHVSWYLSLSTHCLAKIRHNIIICKEGGCSFKVDLAEVELLLKEFLGLVVAGFGPGSALSVCPPATKC